MAAVSMERVSEGVDDDASMVGVGVVAVEGTDRTEDGAVEGRLARGMASVEKTGLSGCWTGVMGKEDFEKSV